MTSNKDIFNVGVRLVIDVLNARNQVYVKVENDRVKRRLKACIPDAEPQIVVCRIAF